MTRATEAVTPVRSEDEPGTWQWGYAAGQAELALLHQLVSEGSAAAENVHYARNFGSLETSADFRVGALTCSFLMRSSGRVEAVEGCEIRELLGGVVLVIPVNDAGSFGIILRVRDAAPVAAIAVASAEHGEWEVRLPNQEWGLAHWRAGGDHPPHQLATAFLTQLPVSSIEGLHDFGDPVLGRLVIESATRPIATVGESVQEALADPLHSETRMEFDQESESSWVSRHEGGFRYAKVQADDVRGVTARARRHPTPVRGKFQCSDERLSTIWSTAARTLHTCMSGLVLDGIKRDRMPWIGDQALATLSNAYAIGDGEIIQDGLVALGQVTDGYVNGISDYSLWWLINARVFARYFDAHDFLEREADRIEAFVAALAALADRNGVLRPPEAPHTFVRVFIDWGVETDPDRDSTALQMLWYWALQSAVEILHSIGREAHQWEQLQQRILDTLRHTAWDDRTGVWREYLNGATSVTPYANFLAVLAGASTPDEPGIVALLEGTERVGTPFMTSFLLKALAAGGRSELALERVRALWGSMLDHGARTFWEEFPEPGASPYEMYGRPFGKSLCHGWSAGPAAMLPEMILGLRPLEDAWAVFEVRPRLGELLWADATVPTTRGAITVHAERDGTGTVSFPARTALLLKGRMILGPAQVDLASALSSAR